MSQQTAQRRYPTGGLLLFGVLAVVLLVLGALSTVKGLRDANSQASVVGVVDAQTVTISADGEQQTVTLAGVAAPRPPAEGQEPTTDNCLSEEALQFVQEKLPQGATVNVDTKQDLTAPPGTVYGVVRVSGDVLNEQMVAEGLAVNTDQGTTAQTTDRLRQANEQARENEVGLYSTENDCTLVARVENVIAEMESVPTEETTTSEDAQAVIDQLEPAVAEAVSLRDTVQGLDETTVSFTAAAYKDVKGQLAERIDAAAEAGQRRMQELTGHRNALEVEEKRAEREGDGGGQDQQDQGNGQDQQDQQQDGQSQPQDGESQGGQG